MFGSEKSKFEGGVTGLVYIPIELGLRPSSIETPTHSPWCHFTSYIAPSVLGLFKPCTWQLTVSHKTIFSYSNSFLWSPLCYLLAVGGKDVVKMLSTSFPFFPSFAWDRALRFQNLKREKGVSFTARPGKKNGDRNGRKDEKEKKWMTNKVNELGWVLRAKAGIAWECEERWEEMQVWMRGWLWRCRTEKNGDPRKEDKHVLVLGRLGTARS